MQAAAAFLRQRFRHKRGVQPVARGNGLHRRFEGYEIIGGFQRAAVLKVDLVLPRALLVMGAFRLHAHLLQRQADFPPDVFPLIQRRNVAVSRPVMRDQEGIALFVGFKQIKLAFRAGFADVSHRSGALHRQLQHPAAVPFKIAAVWPFDVAEQPHHPAMRRPPGQDRKRRRIRNQKQIGFLHVQKTPHGGRIKRNSLLKSPFQLIGHDGNVFLPPKNITEGQTDKFHVVLLHELQNLRYGVIHSHSPFPAGRMIARFGPPPAAAAVICFLLYTI